MKHLGTLSLFLVVVLTACVAVADTPLVLQGFLEEDLPLGLRADHSSLEIREAPAIEGKALSVLLEESPSSGFLLEAQEKAWDLSAYSGISFLFHNPNDHALSIRISVANKRGKGKLKRSKATFPLAAQETRRIPFFFHHTNTGPYWGMRGIPVYGPMLTTGLKVTEMRLDLSQIDSISVQVRDPKAGDRLLVDDIQAFPEESPLARLVEHPFIDILGQFKHAQWPEKVAGEAGLKRSLEHENALLATMTSPEALDHYGAWKNGPQLEATGWFRTEKVDGRWWLVSPEGHLFFSMGVACVNQGDSTFVQGREDWFESLPKAGEAYAEFYGSKSHVHSMAEAIGGGGTTYKLSLATLKRKYGPDNFLDNAEKQTVKRFKVWGFNTLGNWTSATMRDKNQIPFVIGLSSGDAPMVEGSSGYWRKMKDVFDPAFTVNTTEKITQAIKRYANNPMLLGYFVDNEESWKGLAGASLNSPPDQAARIRFIRILEEKYGDLEALNKAWATEAQSWDSLRLPRRSTDNTKEDAEHFEYLFAKKYFETIKTAIRSVDANHLYMGCRFTLMYCPKPAVRACAEVCDVMSINAYMGVLQEDFFVDYDKPVIIGEFHFGALDVGMFHPGLQAAENQTERAAKYSAYVNSVAANPVFVGCHWFQYRDQPLTGRSYDGENYQIGLVTVADEPYQALTEAARQCHAQLYPARYSGALNESR